MLSRVLRKEEGESVMWAAYEAMVIVVFCLSRKHGTVGGWTCHPEHWALAQW